MLPALLLRTALPTLCRGPSSSTVRPDGTGSGLSLLSGVRVRGFDDGRDRGVELGLITPLLAPGVARSERDALLALALEEGRGAPSLSPDAMDVALVSDDRSAASPAAARETTAERFMTRTSPVGAPPSADRPSPSSPSCRGGMVYFRPFAFCLARL